MALRTKPTVDAGVFHKQSIGGAPGVFLEYQPGNGTRYPVSIVHLELEATALQLLGFSAHEPAGVFMVSVFQPYNRTHLWRDEGFLHWTQVAEHLGFREPDARVVAELIARFTNRQAEPAGEVEATPPPCSACNGTGASHPPRSGVCEECDGEGVRRASK